ncbi:MAG: radical SAM protein, partial [Chloroflexi bacterium]|nr:radical SAM protein [Chloroflexota bacterium]
QEIHCKTLLNRIDIPSFPFQWTLNPYRGCRHACRYCYARPTHEFLGLDAGREFEQRIFAKVNAPEVLRQELRRPKWKNEAIAIGTASDPYEPAEMEYRLTRRILQVLCEFRTPASITTKGVLVRRDVDVLQELGRVADVRVNFSVGSIDERVWKLTEPGAPSPVARLEAMQFLVENGINAGVMMAPLLPGISDSTESIYDVAEAAAAHGARFIGANVLFLKPGSKEWFMPMLKETYPHLAPGYAKMYAKTYAPRDYTSSVMKVVDQARRSVGLASMEPTKSMDAPQRQLQLALSA